MPQNCKLSYHNAHIQLLVLSRSTLSIFTLLQGTFSEISFICIDGNKRPQGLPKRSGETKHYILDREDAVHAYAPSFR
jgi:hypothetical protein